MNWLKYNIAASDKKTSKELAKKTPYFDLTMWDEYKIKQQMLIEFACRKKNLVKGLYKCKKCGCDEVYTQSIQLRAGDEATSNFAMCSNPDCKSKPWEV